MAEYYCKLFRQPYVGTHHLLLSYLYKNDNKAITFYEFYKYVKNIGSCRNRNEYTLYTPLLRDYEKESNIKDVILKILDNDNSIAYNILLNNKINISELYDEVLNS